MTLPKKTERGFNKNNTFDVGLEVATRLDLVKKRKNAWVLKRL